MIVAHKALVNGVLIAENVSCTLPSIEFGTSELKGSGIMGTLSISSPMMLSELTTSFVARRVKKEISEVIKGGKNEIEYRFVEDVTASDGRVIAEGTKIFLSGYLTKFELGKIENGAEKETSAEFNVYRYREIVEGEEKICIDKLAEVFRIDGKSIIAEYQSRL